MRRTDVLLPGLVTIALMLCSLPGNSQSSQGSYSLSQSGGNSVSPLQPPPNSDLWNLQQRVAKLNDLQQEIQQYQATQYLVAINRGIDDPNYNPFTVWQVFFFNIVGALQAEPWVPPQGNKTHPPADDGTSPPWAQDAIQDAHLESLQNAIGYDANHLGLTFDPSGAVGDVLNQLTGEISTEISSANAVLNNRLNGQTDTETSGANGVLNPLPAEPNTEMPSANAVTNGSGAGVTDILQQARQRQNDLSSAEEAAQQANADLDARIVSAQTLAGALTAQQANGIKIRIPADWVPCQCPDQHVGAGIIVNGVQYHTPLLHCQ